MKSPVFKSIILGGLFVPVLIFVFLSTGCEFKKVGSTPTQDYGITKPPPVEVEPPPPIEEPPEIDTLIFEPPPEPADPVVPPMPVADDSVDVSGSDSVNSYVTDAIQADTVEAGSTLDLVFTATENIVENVEDATTIEEVSSNIETTGGGSISDPATIETFTSTVIDSLQENGSLPQNLQTENIDSLMKHVEEDPILQDLLASFGFRKQSYGYEGKIMTINPVKNLFKVADYGQCIQICEDTWIECKDSLNAAVNAYWQVCVDSVNIFFDECTAAVDTSYNACLDSVSLNFTECTAGISIAYNLCQANAADSLSDCLNFANANLAINMDAAQTVFNQMMALAQELTDAGPPLSDYAPILQNLAIILFLNQVQTASNIYLADINSCDSYNSVYLQECEDNRTLNTENCDSYQATENQNCENFRTTENQNCIDWRTRELQGCDDYKEGVDTSECDQWHSECITNCHESGGG